MARKKREYYDISNVVLDSNRNQIGTADVPTIEQREQVQNRLAQERQKRAQLEDIRTVKTAQQNLRNAENEFSAASDRYENALSRELKKTGIDYRTRFDDMSKKKISYETKNEDKPKNQPTVMPIVEVSKNLKKELDAKDKAYNKWKVANYENDLARVNTEKSTVWDKTGGNVTRAIKDLVSPLTTGEDRVLYDEKGNKTFLPTYNEMKQQKVREDTGGLAGAAQDILYNATKIAGAGALDLATGGIGGKALYWTDMATDNYKNVRNQGYDNGSAIANTIVATGSEFLTEKLLGGLAKPLTGKQISSTQKAFANAFTKATKNPKVANILGSMTSEGLEEFTQELVGALNDKVTLGKDTNIDQLAQDAVYSALIGAGSGGLITSWSGNIEGNIAQQQLNAMNENLTDLRELNNTNGSRRVTNAIKAGEEFANKPFTTDFNKAMEKVSRLNEVERNALVEITQKRLRGEAYTQEDIDTLNFLDMRDEEEPQTTEQQPVETFEQTPQNQPVQVETMQPVQEAPAQEEVEEKPRNVGVHYGDLGKANDTYYSNISKSRGTGHLGTGTYFVSEDYKPGESSTYAKRPANEVNFDGYNLYKPSTDQEGYDLHDGLKAINSKSLFNKEDVGNLQEKYNTYLKDLSEDSVNDLVNTLDKQGYDVEDIKKDLETGWTTRAETNLKDMTEDIIDDYDRLYKSYNNMIEQIKKNNPSISDEAINKAFEETNKTLQSYNEKGYKYGQYPTPSVDSLSTVFMKNLGYEGVDVRHLKGLNDTTYGSVIYDLKNKEKETANIVRDTYKDIKNRNVKATIAPYYNTRLTKENYTTIRDAVDESFKSTANNIATLLGGKIKDTTNNIGGFTFDEGETAGSWVRELSYTFELENMSKEDAILFTSLMGDLGHEQQEAVIAATYEDDINNSNAVEFRLNYKNRDKLSKALDDLGIHDYTIDTNNKTLKLLEFDDLNNPVQTAKKIADIIEKLGGDLEDAEYSGIQSEYITKGTRERAYKTWLEANKRSEENRQLYSLVEQAYKKVEGSIAKEEGTSDSSFSNENIPAEKEKDTVLKFKNPQEEKQHYKDQGVKDNVAQIMTEMPKPEDDKTLRQKIKDNKASLREEWSWFKRKFVDKGEAIYTLAKKTKNRMLYAMYDKMGTAPAESQFQIGKAQTTLRGNIYHNFKDASGRNVSMSLNQIWDSVQDIDPKITNEYLAHYLNMDRYKQKNLEGDNKYVFGENVTDKDSEKRIKQLEKKYPKLKTFGNNVWQYGRNQLKNMVDAGLISKAQAQQFVKDTPHYVRLQRNVPGKSQNTINVDKDGKASVNKQIKEFKGSTLDILPFKDSMAQYTMDVTQSIRANLFGQELAKTLGMSSTNSDISSVDEVFGFNPELIKQNDDGTYSFTVFNNGGAVTLPINQGIYEALQPSKHYEFEDKALFKGVRKFDNVRKALLTDKNPLFLATNMIKDLLDAPLNSQHPTLFAKNYIPAIKQIVTKGKMFQQYQALGGLQNTYFEHGEGFKKQGSKYNPLNWIEKANNAVEQFPRLAEFMATMQKTGNIDEAMYNAAEITTNFKRGGDITKAANRNGATFLNASVQGFSRQVRNFTDVQNPQQAVKLLAKVVILGIAPALYNDMAYDDDDEYQDLQDYIKDNYYLFKGKNGTWIRIPKGRAVSVFQSAARRTRHALKGEKGAYKGMVKNAANQVAPNNPFENNIISPFVDVKRNESWSGNPIVSEYMKNEKHPEEEYDVKTDDLSKWLGKTFHYSPKKINYIIDQYSGVIGDFALPIGTKYAESKSDSRLYQALVNPALNKFTTNSVTSSKAQQQFYQALQDAEDDRYWSKGTTKDTAVHKYLSSKNREISAIRSEMTKLQESNKPDSEKFEGALEYQKQINEIAKDAVKQTKKVNSTGEEFVIGGKYYSGPEANAIKSETVEKAKNIGLSVGDYIDVTAKYSDLKADKDSNGKTIPGSKKQKFIDYVNSKKELTTQQKIAIIQKYYKKYEGE